MARYFEARRPYISWTKYFNFGFFGDTEPISPDILSDKVSHKDSD